ncbi:MAG TPA: chorismate synthase [Candidatus Polarisedimenticolia bacterium]|jgi:chorismate synthase|nr:chorismate synthase [Candidatus Polarisedimenticolia bacterium]
MSALRFLTAGESHGPGLLAILEGVPAALPLLAEDIDRDLGRRQHGYGRGARMKIEQDRAEIVSGVRHGKTIGSPIGLRIANRDWDNWRVAMAVEPVSAEDAAKKTLTRPRPGHADLAGALKYGTHDARDVLERASARETTARVAVGAICRRFLQEFGIEVRSHTLALGPAAADPSGRERTWEEIGAAEGSPLRCADPGLEKKMMDAVDAAKKAGDSIGGAFEVVARGVPPGLGSMRQWDERLSALLLAAIGSIPSIKGVVIGAGEGAPAAQGSGFHDPIGYDAAAGRFTRPSNHAGGLEGGMSNGEEIRVRALVKPLSTLPRALPSVDLVTKEAFEAQVERTDVTAIAAAGVVGEAMTAFVLARAFLEKFGGDSIPETARHHASYIEALRRF